MGIEKKLMKSIIKRETDDSIFPLTPPIILL